MPSENKPTGVLGQFVHISIDTASGVIFASLHTVEASKNVIDHCLQAFNAMGLPKLIKTDNGPSYSSKNFISFCKEFGIKHKTGIPYNPMGQGIVERAHHSLKKWLLNNQLIVLTAEGYLKDTINLGFIISNWHSIRNICQGLNIDIKELNIFDCYKILQENTFKLDNFDSTKNCKKH